MKQSETIASEILKLLEKDKALEFIDKTIDFNENYETTDNMVKEALILTNKKWEEVKYFINKNYDKSNNNRTTTRNRA